MSDSDESDGGNYEGTVSFDVGNLACFDTTDFEQEEGVSIEETLRTNASSLTEQLLKEIFDQPVEPPRADTVGRVAQLPTPNTLLPREKPVPKPKEETVWEKFAKTKGIVKKKKDRMVFDETHDEWRPRWGYKKADDELDVWAMPVEKGDDPTIDPWTKLATEKKEKVKKNKQQQLKNLKSSLKAAPGKNRVAGALDLSEAAKGVSGGSAQSKGKKGQKKTHVDVSLELAQKSTASMGRFDKTRKYEQDVKLYKIKGSEAPVNVTQEKKASLSVFNRILGEKPGEAKTFNSTKAANMAIASGADRKSVV